MKKILAFMLSAIMIFSAGCNKTKEVDGKKVTLYFLDSNKSNMVTEERAIPEGEDEIMFALNALISGPENPEYKRAVPEDARVHSVECEGSIATVNMSDEFNRGTKMEKLWSRYTLINTVCSVEGVRKAQILVDGKVITSISTNEPLGAIGKDDIVTDITQVTTDKTVATLYFSDENASKLVPEAREVSHKEGENIEKLIVEALIEGPVNKNLYPALPQGIKVLSTETKDGVCFINLSAEFSTVGMGGSMETLAVYSIVNTLCSIRNTEKVQILVEGKKIDGFGHLNLSEPLEKNEDIIR